MEDNIHTPTIPSGPTNNGTNGVPRASLSLPQLAREKDRLEAELKALGSVLDSHGVGMQTSLLTFDGFPRSDIDVAQIRTTRARINYLKTDYKAVMAAIENGLHQHFADQKDHPGSTRSGPPVSGRIHPTATPLPPFARVNTVNPSSPAAAAGLQPGDRICKFGDSVLANHERLSRISSVVQEAVAAEKPVSVIVQRAGYPGDLTLSLLPRANWGGRGLLGCHVVPL